MARLRCGLRGLFGLRCLLLRRGCGSAYESDCVAGGGLWRWWCRLRRLRGGLSGGNGDGQVSVDDLLAIITVWGQSCDGCSEDLDASGAIGVDDLLQVIANWQSPCP